MARRTKKLIVHPEDEAGVLITAEVPGTDGDREIVLVADEKGHTAINPDTGLSAVWLRGEVVPEWAASEEDLARLQTERDKANPPEAE